MKGGEYVERAKKQYNVLEDEVIERVDKLADKLDLNRSQLLRNLILSGLEDAEFLNKSGILTISKISRDIKEKFLGDIVTGNLGLKNGGGS